MREAAINGIYKNSSIVGSIDNKCLSQFKATEKQLNVQLIFIVIVRTSNQDIPPHNNCGDANRMTIDPNDQLFYGIVIISETFSRIRLNLYLTKTGNYVPSFASNSTLA